MNLDRKLLDGLSNVYGNSFYILDSESFKHNCQDLMSAFKVYYQNFNIAYSYKTNYIPALVKIVDSLGGYAEIVSEMEMEVALRSGVHPSRIIWNGPIKNELKVKKLLLAGGMVNIDSVYEIENIRQIAVTHPNHILHVGVRCNYDVGDEVLSRFGFDVDGEDFHKVITFIKDTPNLNLVSLQAHFAKRNPVYWAARAKGMLEIYDRVVSEYGLKPERLDIGGGIYGKMPVSLCNQLGIEMTCYDDYASRAATLFADHFKEQENPPALFIEPGSAVAGDSMKFVTRIKTIKKVRGKSIATTLGSQKNISMAELNPPMEIVSGGSEQQEYVDLDIAGFTCIESDFLCKGYTGKLGIGDYVIISNCGSYSVVMKPPFILPNFPVLDVCNGETKLIKRQEYFDDLFHTFCF